MESNTTPSHSTEQLAIVGGGISGLSAAYYALKQGVPADQIHIYEGEKKLGGKIQTEMLDGIVVNKGAEFIDKEQDKILGLCHELGVPLKASEDQGDLKFQRPNGEVIDSATFLKAYRPIAEQIIAYKSALNQPGTAAMLNNMSMQDFIGQLAQNAVQHKREARGFFGRIWDTVTFKSYQIDPDILTIIQNAYASEVGAPANKINALQFVGEASDQFDSIFSSGCEWRVEGGTAKIIDALHEKLAAAGVHFHTGEKLHAVRKEGEKIHLTMQDGKEVISHKAIMALPAYDLAKIQGLESLGLSNDATQLIGNTQYTNSIKFTVRLKPGITADVSNLYSSKAYQSWSSAPGQMTFLCETSDLKGGTNPAPLIRSRLEEYAKSQGKTAAEMFDCITPDGKLTNNGMVLTSAPKSPCYASPTTGQALQLQKLGAGLDNLASNGVGVVGTYLPVRDSSGSLGFGFMECGLNSAQRTVGAMLSPEPQKTHWQEYLKQREETQSKGVTLH